MGKVNEPKRGVDTIYGFPIQQIFLADDATAVVQMVGVCVRQNGLGSVWPILFIAFNVHSVDFYCDGIHYRIVFNQENSNKQHCQRQ